MATRFKEGQHIFFLMRNGETQLDSQNKPRYYLTRDRAEKYARSDSEIVEYAPVYNTESDCFVSKDVVNEYSLKQLVDKLVSLNDENLAQRVIDNSDVQWCLSELQDILAADVVTAPQWINCEDKLPPFGEDVLMLFESNMTVGFLRDTDEHLTFWSAYVDDGFYTDCEESPLYWMSLPERPKMDGGDGDA